MSGKPRRKKKCWLLVPRRRKTESRDAAADVLSGTEGRPGWDWGVSPGWHPPSSRSSGPG